MYIKLKWNMNDHHLSITELIKTIGISFKCMNKILNKYLGIRDSNQCNGLSSVKNLKRK